MNDKKTTSELVDSIIDSATEIDTIKTPPFFKDKVLQQLLNIDEAEPVRDWLVWFTPKYQIAALFVFLVLNFSVLYSYSHYTEQQNIKAFAEAYGLSDSQNDYILN